MPFVRKKITLIFILFTIIAFSHSLSAGSSTIKDLNKAKRKCKITYEQVADGREIFLMNTFEVKKYESLTYRGNSVKKTIDFINNDLCDRSGIGILMYINSPKMNRMACYETPENIIKNTKLVGTNGIGKKLKQLQKQCVEFYSTKFFGATLAKLKKSEDTARVAKKKNQQKIAADKKRKVQLHKKQVADAKTEEKNKRSNVLALLSPSLVGFSQSIIWETSLSDKNIKDRSRDAKRHINAMNKAILDSTGLSSINQKFTPPGKGEFEKSSDYKLRVAKKKAVHNKEIQDKKDDLSANSSDNELKVFNSYFGDPLITNIKYDADVESFGMTISSSAFKYSITASYNVPITEAKKVKERLSKAIPTVSFIKDGDILKPAGVALQFKDKAVLASSIGKGNTVIFIGNEQLSKWNATLAEEKNVRLAQKRKDDALEKERIAKRNAVYNHKGPYLEKGSFACVSMESAFKMMTIRRINSYAADPVDCVAASAGLAPITNVNHMQGNISKVLLKNNGMSAYVQTADIIY